MYLNVKKNIRTVTSHFRKQRKPCEASWQIRKQIWNGFKSSLQSKTGCFVTFFKISSLELNKTKNQSWILSGNKILVHFHFWVNYPLNYALIWKSKQWIDKLKLFFFSYLHHNDTHNACAFQGLQYIFLNLRKNKNDDLLTNIFLFLRELPP